MVCCEVALLFNTWLMLPPVPPDAPVILPFAETVQAYVVLPGVAEKVMAVEVPLQIVFSVVAATTGFAFTVMVAVAAL